MGSEEHFRYGFIQGQGIGKLGETIVVAARNVCWGIQDTIPRDYWEGSNPPAVDQQVEHGLWSSVMEVLFGAADHKRGCRGRDEAFRKAECETRQRQADEHQKAET